MSKNFCQQLIKTLIFAVLEKRHRERSNGASSAMPSSATKQGSVVQLVRMLPCHGRGRGFESRPVRKALKSQGFFHFDINP